MRFLNIFIAWLKSRISPVHDARVVPHPDADLVEADTGAGEERSEGMAHDVWCYPWDGVFGTVIVKRSGKVVTVTVRTVLNLGPEHIGFSESVVLEKIKKASSKWNSSLLTVFKLYCWRLAQMQQL